MVWTSQEITRELSKNISEHPREYTVDALELLVHLTVNTGANLTATIELAADK
jgi:hypothetical protein